MPRRSNPHHSIEDDTGIMPLVLAETVVERASELLGYPIDNLTLAGYLVGHAEATYAASPSFRKKIRSEADHGNRGRDILFNYMQHWLSSKILHDTENSPSVRQALVDSGFSVGKW